MRGARKIRSSSKECFKARVLALPPLLPLLLLVALPLWSGSLRAQELRTIPSPLREWVSWVLEKEPTRGCPEIEGVHRCVWYRGGQITTRSNGATFTFTVDTNQHRMVQIPGELRAWPQSVRVQSGDQARLVPVVSKRGVPHVELSRGTHEISGEFLWSVVPQSLLVPRDMGTITLVVDGEQVPRLKRDKEGKVWLGHAEERPKDDQDTVSFSVARLLWDGVPFLVDTAITMRVTGRPRRMVLPEPLPPGSILVSYTSPLEIGFPASGELEIELMPGVHVLALRTLYNTPPSSLAAPKILTTGWPEEEYWAWEPEERLRRIRVAGGTEVDPARAPIPSQWKSYSVYAVPIGSQITFEEIQSGEIVAQEKPRYSLNRQAWIHPDGGTLTISDTLRRTAGRAGRLNASQELVLHRVLVDKNAVMISKDPDGGAEGVELRSKRPSIIAEGEFVRTRGIPAVGWDTDVENVEWSVHIPTGWSLLHVGGPDSVTGSWVTGWTSSSVITVIAITLCFAILTSWGSVVAAAALLVFPTPAIMGALTLILLVQGARRWFGGSPSHRVIDLFLILFLLLPVADEVLRLAFPSLAPQPRHEPSVLVQILLDTLSGLPGLLVMVCAFLVSIVLLAMKRSTGAGIAGGIFVLVLLARTLIDIRSPVPSAKTNLRPRPENQDDVITRFAADVDLLRKQQNIMRSELLSEDAAKKEESLEQKLSDPNAIPQTGVGLPLWSGNSATLKWEGKVDSRSSTVELILLSPFDLRLIAIVYLLSSLILISNILRQGKRATRTIGASLLVPTLLFVQSSRADDIAYFPTQDLLEELGNRITANECKKECVSNPRLHIGATAEEVIIDAEVHSLGTSAWPLPGPLSSLVPTSVLIDNAEASLAREGDDTIWVKIPEGIHRIRAIGYLPHPSHNVVRFRMRPGHFTYELGPWKVGGLDDRGMVGDALHLSLPLEGPLSKLNTDRDPSPWYQITRHLELDVDWSVKTTVERNGHISKPSMIEVPLLEGEVVRGRDMRVHEGVAQVAFIEGARTVSWRGEIPKEGTITLESPKSETVSEAWKVMCTTTWQCSHSSAIRRNESEGSVVEEIFYPFPGDPLELMVRRPTGKVGPTKTLLSVHHTISRAKRELTGVLAFKVLSSKRSTETITLPQGAELTSIEREKQRLNVPLKDSSINVPIELGESSYEVHWRMPSSRSIIESLPAITFESSTYNSTIRSDAGGRWTLWLEQKGRAPFV